MSDYNEKQRSSVSTKAVWVILGIATCIASIIFFFVIADELSRSIHFDNGYELGMSIVDNDGDGWPGQVNYLSKEAARRKAAIRMSDPEGAEDFEKGFDIGLARMLDIRRSKGRNTY